MRAVSAVNYGCAIAYKSLTYRRDDDYSESMSPGLQSELKQKSPFTSAEQEAYLALLRTADVLETQVEAKLKEFGLTGTQYNALRILRGAGSEGLPCSEIGERMITRDPDITRLLDRMEKQELITRERQTDDRRVVKTRVTSKGLDILKNLDGPVHEMHKNQFEHLSSAQLKELVDLLEAVHLREAALVQE